MKTATRFIFSVIFLFAAFFATSSSAQIRFTGDVSTAWSNDANWEGGFGPGNHAVIPSDKLVDLDVAVGIGSVTMEPNSNIRNAGGSLSISGSFNIQGGTIGVDCQDPNLPVSIGSEATLTFSTTAAKGVSSCVVINNAGHINWLGGPVYFDGVLNNAGLFTISGNAGFGSASRTGVINNTGRIEKVAGNGVTQFAGFTPETNSIATAINNMGGVVAVASGTIEMGPGMSDGEFFIGAGKTLLVSQDHTFDEATFTGGGTCSLSANTTHFLGHVNSTADIELTGQIEGGTTARPAAFLEGTGRLLWKSGRLFGTLTLGEGIHSIVSEGATKQFDGEITNQGTMDWAGGGPLASNSSTFRNEGTFNVLAGGVFLADTYINGSGFENSGTLNTFAGGTSSTDDNYMTNSGIVNIGGVGGTGVFRPRGFAQTATGVLNMEVGGANGSTPDFDQILAGSLQIDGRLNVTVINDYTPPKDARFTLVDYHSGKFAQVHLPEPQGRFSIEDPGNAPTVLVSNGDTPLPPPPFPMFNLWAAGRDLAANESPDRPGETLPINEKVPQWSYGYRATAASTALTLFTSQQHVNDASGLQGWIATGQATLGVNVKTTPIVFNTGAGDYKPLPPKQIYMSPGSGNEFLVARWTAPEDGDYRVLARWTDLDNHGGNGATAYLMKNGEEQFTEEFRSTSTKTGRAWFRARTFALNTGDTLDFVVGSNGENLFDATAFNAVVRRVPHVTITSPASGTELTGTQNVTFNVDVQHSGATLKATLTVDDLENVVSDSTAPYSLTASLKPGYHKITAVVTDADGAKVESPEVVVIVAPPSQQQRSAANGQTSAVSPQPNAVTTGKLFRSTRGGGSSWHDPATWGNQGVPGRWDYVIIESGHDVVIEFGIQVRDLTVNGRLAGSALPNPALDVFGTLQLNHEISNLDLYINGPAGKLLCLGNSSSLRFVNLINQSRAVITADSFGGEGVTIENRGSIQAGPRATSQGPLDIPIVGLRQTGGQLKLLPNTTVRVPAGLQILGGNVQLAPGQLISDNGAIHIAADASTLVGPDGSTLVGNDGSTLVGPDGSTLIGNDGSTLIGNDGSTRPAPGRISSGNKSAATNGDEAAAGQILLDGGIVTGNGELRGEVVNRGAYLSPGGSAGGIVVSGNYTQTENGTLLLEIGGSGVAPLAYDVLQVTGTANLGGNLILKTINNYTPPSGQALPQLLYGDHTGSFDHISSNAQVTLGAQGAQVAANGPNPAAPKALNISTRGRVESGDNVLIGGFIITGNEPKKVVVRAIGPSLAQFLNGALPNPKLSLFDANTMLSSNDDWRSTQEQELINLHLNPSNDLESAIVATLQPGAYTAIVSENGHGAGVGLVEVYDASSAIPTQLANISTRGLVQTGDNVMIGGFILGGDYPAKVVVRAVGPSLTAFGVPNALQDPTLEIVDGNGNSMSNDDWRSAQDSDLLNSNLAPSDDREAAILALLPPGAYTAIVRGQDETTGVALIEAYNIP